MSLHQIYYTANEAGSGRRSGFGIQAASEGLPTPVLEAVERRSGYRPPSTMAYNPDLAPEDFPHALAAYILPQHKVAVIARSVYLGSQGIGGRGGNFFTHALIGLDGPTAFGDLIPIQLWDGDHWVARAYGETRLPIVAPPAPNPTFTLEAIPLFLRDPQRRAALGPFIEATLAALQGKRRIVIVAPPVECAGWIAVATFALPRSLAWKVSFTTYTRDADQQDALICGVDPEEYRAWGRRSLSQNRYLLHVEQAPPPQAPLSSLAEFITRAYNAGDTRLIDQFLTFFERLRGQPDVPTLESCLAVFQLAQELHPSPEAILRVLPLFKRLYAAPQEEIQAVLRHLDTLEPRSPANQERIWDLLTDAQRQPVPGAQFVAALCRDWFVRRLFPIATLDDLSRLQSWLASTPQRWPDAAEPLRLRLRQLHPDDNQMVAALFQFCFRLGLNATLAPDRLTIVRQLLAVVSTEHRVTPSLLKLVVVAHEHADTLILHEIFDTLGAASDSPDSFDPWRELLKQPPVYEYVRRQRHSSPQRAEQLILLHDLPPYATLRELPVVQRPSLLRILFPKQPDERPGWLTPWIDRHFTNLLFPPATPLSYVSAAYALSYAGEMAALSQLGRRIFDTLLDQPRFKEESYYELLRLLRSWEQRLLEYEPGQQASQHRLRLLNAMLRWHLAQDAIPFHPQALGRDLIAILEFSRLIAGVSLYEQALETTLLEALIRLDEDQSPPGLFRSLFHSEPDHPKRHVTPRELRDLIDDISASKSDNTHSFDPIAALARVIEAEFATRVEDDHKVFPTGSWFSMVLKTRFGLARTDEQEEALRKLLDPRLRAIWAVLSGKEQDVANSYLRSDERWKRWLKAYRALKRDNKV